MKRRILVISNDLTMCTGIREHMQDRHTDICCMTSAVAALASYMEQDYSLVILDIQRSDMDDLELLQTFSREKHTPILALAESSNVEDTVTLLHAGADACVGKPVNLDVCAAQANALIQLCVSANFNHKPHTPMIYDKELMIIPCRRQVIVEGTPLTLTRKEFDLLRCFADSPGRVFTREQLYDHIWDDGPAIAIDETVRSQIKRLRRKLALVGKNYIQTEWGVGYKFVLPNHEV